MLIFKDIITNDELFTDSNKVDLIDDCLYEVKCTYITRRQGEIILAGSNPSAEDGEGDAGGDDNIVSGLDLVLNQNLQSTKFSKKDYMTYLRSYGKSLVEKWTEQGLNKEQIDNNKVKFTEAAKKVTKKLSDDVQCFTGESCNPDGMVAIVDYRDNPDGTEDVYMLFFKHGVESIKV